MSLHVTGTIDYPDADPQRVFAMLIDPEFQRRKCAATGATSYDVDIRPSEPKTVIRCRRTLPTNDLPDFVKPFAAGGLELIETITWGSAAADGARVGEVVLAFTSQPLSMTGTLRMTAAGAGTRADLEANLIAAIPLLGGRVERACEPLVQAALRTEETVGDKWLAEHR